MQPINSTGAMNEEFTCQALSWFRTVADCSHIPQLQLEHVRDIVQIPQAFLTRLGVNICDGRFHPKLELCRLL